MKGSSIAYVGVILLFALVSFKLPSSEANSIHVHQNYVHPPPSPPHWRHKYLPPPSTWRRKHNPPSPPSLAHWRHEHVPPPPSHKTHKPHAPWVNKRQPPFLTPNSPKPSHKYQPMPLRKPPSPLIHKRSAPLSPPPAAPRIPSPKPHPRFRIRRPRLPRRKHKPVLKAPLPPFFIFYAPPPPPHH